MATPTTIPVVGICLTCGNDVIIFGNDPYGTAILTHGLGTTIEDMGHIVELSEATA